MRPNIPDALEDRVKSIYDVAGYATESELVRDAVRTHLNDLEDEYPDAKPAPTLTTTATEAPEGVAIGRATDTDTEFTVNRFTDETAASVLNVGKAGSGVYQTTENNIRAELNNSDSTQVVVIDPFHTYDSLVDDLDVETAVHSGTPNVNLFEDWRDHEANRLARASDLLSHLVQSRYDDAISEDLNMILHEAKSRAFESAETPTGSDVMDVLEEMTAHPGLHTIFPEETIEARLRNGAAQLTGLLRPLIDGETSRMVTDESPKQPDQYLGDERLVHVTDFNDHPGAGLGWMQVMAEAAARSESDVMVVCADPTTYLPAQEYARWVPNEFRDPSGGISYEVVDQSVNDARGLVHRVRDSFPYLFVHQFRTDIDEQMGAAYGLDASELQYAKNCTALRNSDPYEALFSTPDGHVPLSISPL